MFHAPPKSGEPIAPLYGINGHWNGQDLQEKSVGFEVNVG